MTENKHFKELIDEIRSFPEPDYEKDFSTKKQEEIHENLMKVAREQDSKRRKDVRRKGWTIVFSEVAVGVVLLFGMLYLSLGGLNKQNTLDTDNHPIEENQQVTTNEEDEKESEKTTESPEEGKIIPFDESRYQEIVEIYDNYELVTDGVEVDYIDDKYGVIYYVNGIGIFQEGKSIAIWPWGDDPTIPNEPEPYQELAAIKASIEGLKNGGPITKGKDYKIDYPADIEQKLSVLYRTKGYTNASCKPLVDFINSTISYLEEAQRLWEENPEKSIRLYDQAMNNVVQFMKELGSGFA
ncbi:hypothetical protein BN1058_01486 [Paraliobacillus sp. PM-2]|uniref:hypothetical protein n=1 Tax=Paraliobacillus sp. PM-2 TaxID=1462524 RepID=UPI00061BD4AE|nr:hypothetical protein [Paraliobacillus sp. PM-2]CQR47195.1 hypothetical protein BN1058_01486 [Paraliobacillus sp. PM-2]